MDVQQPGFQLPPTTGQTHDVVGLEGVLLSPSAESIPVEAGCSLPADLATSVNLPVTLQTTGPADAAEDPVISVPLYGRWHALVDRVQAFPEHRNWINELNSDPRFRTVAGFGTKVIQQNQESYMKLAWDQIGDIVSMNRRITFLQMSVKASDALYAKHLAPMQAERMLAIGSPVMSKVLGSPITVHALVQRSRLPRVVFSGAMRKLLRDRGRLARRAIDRTGSAAALESMVAGLNEGRLTAAPPRPAPRGVTYEGSLKAVQPSLPEWLRWAARNRQLLLVLLFILAILAFAVAPLLGVAVFISAAAAAAVAYPRLSAIAATLNTVSGFQLAALTPETIETLPPNDAFVLPDPSLPLQPASSGGGADSVQGAAFREAALAFNTRLSARPPADPVLQPLAMAPAHASMMRALKPAPAFVSRFGRTLRVGDLEVSKYIAKYSDLVASQPPPIPASCR